MPENTDHLLGKLNERTENLAKDVHDIKNLIQDHASTMNDRLKALELRNAEASGGIKMMVMFGGAAATIGGIIASFIVKIWPN